MKQKFTIQKFTIMKKLFILLLSIGTATAVFASSNSATDHGYGYNRNGGMYNSPYGYNASANHSGFSYGYNNMNNNWGYNNRRFNQERREGFDRGYDRRGSFFQIMLGGRGRH